MITWILIVFINGMALPTTQFNNLEDCDDFRKVIAAQNSVGKPEPVCFKWYISNKKDKQL